MTDDVLKELGTSIEKAHDALKRELGKLRTGRAHAGMLDGIRVDYYGTPTPIGQMATVAVPEARMLTVKPWDKGSLSLIEKAIRESNLGLNPQNDGELIRVPVPPLSEERRRDLVKIAKKAGEECKVAIRKARHEAIDMLNEFKKDGELSEDETERGKKRVEEVVSTGSGWVDTHIQAKEKEILQV
ncbi:MAG TPA: ribosome recycling factor [Polyangiaceae bacterium]|jgi:ribosome recycling factor|nr:ribosome recycling factor [Polyangiaceae bacterium]